MGKTEELVARKGKKEDGRKQGTANRERNSKKKMLRPWLGNGAVILVMKAYRKISNLSAAVEVPNS